MKTKVFTIECECGEKIKGWSEKHAEQNLKSHKRGKKHKTRMDAIKSVEKKE